MGSEVGSQHRQNDHFGGVKQTNFFFKEKKVDNKVFWSDIYRGLCYEII